MVVLLDSGATHNFISKKLAEELNLPVTLARFVVTLGDERKIKGMGKCKLVEIKSQGVSIIHEFFLFELDSIEIILEVDWLCKLREVKLNWKVQTMKFNWQGRRIELKGDANLCKLEPTLKAIVHTLVEGAEGNLVEYSGMFQGGNPEEQTMEPRLAGLLEEYCGLFREPIRLAPKRNHEHAIRLLSNAQPPNSRPYRYPHFQKNEIEKIVKEMLANGVIRPSISPYSNPML